MFLSFYTSRDSASLSGKGYLHRALTEMFVSCRQDILHNVIIYSAA
jgi:hypothetical protein